MADKVTIEIQGDGTDAEATIKALEREYKKAFNKITETSKESSEAVAKSFQSSGLRTEKAIKESSAKAQRDFERIKNSGVASANDIKRAHIAMTEKIKRNNKELSIGAGLLSKAFTAFKSNIFAISAAAVGLGFALKKAFNFAEFAAKLKAQQTAFKNFAASLGADSDELLKKLTEVSRGTVAQADLTKSAGTALLLGLDPTKIVELLEVARASSKLTGESLTTQFEDVAKGTGRASKLILDNLGIQFSQAEASRRAAAALGVLESELTANQIAVGNLNEVIRQGQPIIRGVGKDFTSQADVLAKIRARYTDLVATIGLKFLKSLPKVEIAVLKLSKAFLVFIKILSQVNKVNSVLLDFFGVTTQSTARAQNGIDNLSKGIETLDKRIISATKVVDQLNEAEKANIEGSKKIIEQAKERISISEAKEKQINKQLKAEVEGINAVGLAQEAQNELLKKSITETKEQIRELEQEVQRSAAFAQQILDEIAGSEKRRAQAGFDPLEKLVDDLKRAEDNFELASQERAAGNVDRARELTLSAVQAANAILEVQKGAASESEVSTRELSKATFEAEKLQKAARGFAIEMQTAATEAVPLVEQQLADLEAQLALGVASVDGVKAAIEDATKKAELLKIKLSENTTATHTQIINTVSAGDNSNPIPGFKTGVRLPGYGGGDKILARLEAGENVIRKESVKRLKQLGTRAMDAIHNGDIGALVKSLPLPGYQKGGEVEPSAKSSVNVNLNLGSKQFPMSASKSTAESFVKEIKSINVVRGRKRNVF